MSKKLIVSGLMAAILGASSAHAELGSTLAEVKARGTLNCPGDTGSFPGFAELDDKGNWKGLDIEMCRAIATAVFGTPEKLKIIPISWAQRWPSLQSGDIDIVIKASGGTLSRDTELGLQFSNSYFLGTTQVLAHTELGLNSLADADGGSICMLAGSSVQNQVANYASGLGITLEPVTMEKTDELQEAYFAGRCDLYAEWGPTLAIARSNADNASAHAILPDVLAMEPEVMIVRQGDERWLDIANWTLSVLLMAEQEGVTSDNVDSMKANPPNATVAKMLGATPGMGSPLGPEDDWAYNVIKHVGNYAEAYGRGLGDNSPYELPRGINALWNEGGVLFPYVID